MVLTGHTNIIHKKKPDKKVLGLDERIILERLVEKCRPGWCSRYSDWLRAEGPGIES
jgi:hypothetical protein